MKIDVKNSLVAILSRIDQQIGEAETLLLKSLTELERHQVTDELAYLRIERSNAATKFNKYFPSAH